MTLDEKITEKKERIKRLQQRRTEDYDRIRNLEREVEALQDQNVLQMIKELDIPFDQLRDTISKIRQGEM